ncbi:glucosylglycerol hydrolase, partial [Bacillus sp. SIMBA_161]
IMLEMQRRKVDFGADAVRVDGAQDFKWWDADNGVLRHDDSYLRAMALVEQEVAGCRYRPWMIFEDGRPWPQVDWELSSTYRAVI